MTSPMKTGATSQNVVPPAVLKRFVFLLLDSFSAFDLMAAIEALKDANCQDGVRIYDWQLVSHDGRPVAASNGMHLDVDFGLESLDRRDTLAVLGGDNFECASTLPVVAWLRKQARLGLRIGGISGGVLTLIKAGIMDGHDVTTHWNYRPALQENFDEIYVDRSVFRQSQNRFSCAGGMATIDLMLALIMRDHGESKATWVADNLVCSAPRTEAQEQTISQCMRVGGRNEKVFEAVRIMSKMIETPISPSQIAGELGISVRQLERLFARYLSATPKAYYMSLRLDHARCILLQTNVKVIEVAVATGFSSASHFSKLYKRKFGVSPYQERAFGPDGSGHFGEGK